MLEKEKRTDDIKAEFELREKRLKLVYKILYVAVALWAALFVAYATTEKPVLPLYCGFLSALTAAILNILYYIFGELRCMKIYAPAADESKVEADSKCGNMEQFWAWGFYCCTFDFDTYFLPCDYQYRIGMDRCRSDGCFIGY